MATGAGVAAHRLAADGAGGKGECEQEQSGVDEFGHDLTFRVALGEPIRNELATNED